ncbi:hypothetical protein OH492_07985 [Vibrio chagasii]|nr:hypothetical protein [Vibrio chagasii]
MIRHLYLRRNVSWYINQFQLVQLSSSLERVDSVDWLIKQLKLADAIGRDDIGESTLQRLFAIERLTCPGFIIRELCS